MLSPNHESRQGIKVDSIVLHSTWGGFQGSVSWLCNTASRASAHYVISRKGEVAQIVPEEETAWHVRANATHQVNPQWNFRSIGIELVDDQHEDGWLTDPQYKALIEVMAGIVQRWGVPLDRGHVKMHMELDAKTDPKGWNDWIIDHLLEDVIKYLNPEEDELTAEQFTELKQTIARSSARVALQVKFGKGQKIKAFKKKSGAAVYRNADYTDPFPSGDAFLDEGYLWTDIIEK